MVAGIYFHEGFAVVHFQQTPNPRALEDPAVAMLVSFVAAFLSAFLDALTVMAVIIAVSLGFYAVYNAVSCRIGGSAGRCS